MEMPKKITILIFHSSAHSGSIRKNCLDNFTKQLKEITEVEIINTFQLTKYIKDILEEKAKKQETKKQAHKIIDHLKQASYSYQPDTGFQPVIVFLQSNRFTDQTLSDNAYGQYLPGYYSKPVNGRAIMLFDGQSPTFKFPHSHQQKGWIQFNKIFKNYWYGPKEQDSMINSDQFLRLERRNYIGAFLENALYRQIIEQVTVYVMYTQQEYYLFQSKQFKQKIHQILHLNGLSSEIILLPTEKMSLDQFGLIKRALKQGFEEPSKSIMFFRDDYEYKWEKLDDIGVASNKLTAVKNPSSHNNWKYFLEPSYISSSLNKTQLNGYTTAFINPLKVKDKSTIDTTVSLRNFCYFTGFTPQNLTRLIHLRYYAQYIKRQKK